MYLESSKSEGACRLYLHSWCNRWSPPGLPAMLPPPPPSSSHLVKQNTLSFRNKTAEYFQTLNISDQTGTFEIMIKPLPSRGKHLSFLVSLAFGRLPQADFGWVDEIISIPHAPTIACKEHNFLLTHVQHFLLLLHPQTVSLVTEANGNSHRLLTPIFLIFPS